MRVSLILASGWPRLVERQPCRARSAFARSAFLIEHGQIVGRLVYERLIARPDRLYGGAIGSSYSARGCAIEAFQEGGVRVGRVNRASIAF